MKKRGKPSSKQRLAKELGLPQKFLPHVTRTELERVRDSELVDRIAEDRESKPKPEKMSAKFDPRVAAAAFLAGDDPENLGTLLPCQLAICLPNSCVPGLDVVTSLMKSLKPRSTLEVLLLSEMAAAHMLGMNEAAEAQHATGSEACDQHTARASRMFRVFAAQVEALQALRSKGKQKIVVRHVNVVATQAVVGSVTAVPRGVEKNER